MEQGIEFHLQRNHNIHFTEETPYSPICSGLDLLHPASLQSFLDVFGSMIRSPRQAVTGSLFGKRYSTLAAGALYSFTVSDYGVNISLNVLQLSLIDKSFHFHLTRRTQTMAIVMGSTRIQRRKQYLTHIFNDNLIPVFSMVSRYTGLDESVLWGHLSYLLAYWKKKWVSQAKSEELKSRIEADYRYIIDEAGSELCVIKKNRLQDDFRCIPVPHHADRLITVRKKCCLNYCLPGEDRYCYTCPKITDERRITKYLCLQPI
ncbi:hypothetical protein PaeBR_01405 [Paenibacillus sp. BR2-3]|uniref:hypothetical protein n=1 Tax=Paenibacillus sp. BR2-3 TaxID=3048494 RepID=UPI0039772970